MFSAYLQEQLRLAPAADEAELVKVEIAAQHALVKRHGDVEHS